MSLFNEKVIRKKVIIYEGSIGPKKNPYMALEKRLKELVGLKELGIVSDFSSLFLQKNQFIFQHFKSGVHLLYENSPSSYGRNEDLSIVLDSRKSSSKDLEKCEQLVHEKFKGFI